MFTSSNMAYIQDYRIWLPLLTKQWLKNTFLGGRNHKYSSFKGDYVTSEWFFWGESVCTGEAFFWTSEKKNHNRNSTKRREGEVILWQSKWDHTEWRSRCKLNCFHFSVLVGKHMCYSPCTTGVIHLQQVPLGKTDLYCSFSSAATLLLYVVIKMAPCIVLSSRAYYASHHIKVV